MSAEATRMQDLASEFSKKFPGVIPRTPTAGGGDPLLHSPPARPLARRGAWCWDPNLVPPQLFSRGCAPACNPHLQTLKVSVCILVVKIMNFVLNC